MCFGNFVCKAYKPALVTEYSHSSFERNKGLPALIQSIGEQSINSAAHTILCCFLFWFYKPLYKAIFAPPLVLIATVRGFSTFATFHNYHLPLIPNNQSQNALSFDVGTVSSTALSTCKTWVSCTAVFLGCSLRRIFDAFFSCLRRSR